MVDSAIGMPGHSLTGLRRQRPGGRVRRLRKTEAAALALAAILAPSVSTTTRAADMDGHAHHHMVAPDTVRSVHEYALPTLTLVRDDGRSVALRDEIEDGRPTVLAFIYTSCTTVCPLTSATLSELQRKLGTARDNVHLMSISIDPEQDTPARLREYAKKFGAGPEWQHYTGTLAASQKVQKAFSVYHGDKMDHAPAAFVRTAPGAPWVRIDGFATAEQLVAELPKPHSAR